MGSRRGFTLIETMIVVAIITVLAAMLFPVCELATKRAERAVCMVNLKHIVMAAHLYADDHDGLCVPARIDGPPRTYGTTWEILLQPYLHNTQLLICPSDRMPTRARGSMSLKHSYGINYDIALLGGYNGAALFLGKVERPARTILFFDLQGAARAMGSSGRLHGVSRVAGRHNEGANFAFVAGNVKWYRPEETLAARSLFDPSNMWQP